MGDENVLSFEVTVGAEILVEEIGGDLVLDGIAEDRVTLEGEDPYLKVTDNGTQVVIRASDDARVTVPENAVVTIREVGGNVRVSNLKTALKIDEVGSDLVIRDVEGPVEVDSVGSDARLTDIQNDVKVGTIGSDLVVRDIAGDVKIEAVGSDLEVKRVDGSVNVETVGSDATFREIAVDLKVDEIGSDLVLIELGGNCDVKSVGSDLIVDCAFEDGKLFTFNSVGSDVVVKLPDDTPVMIAIPSDVERSIGVRDVVINQERDTVRVQVNNPVDESARVVFESIGSEFQLTGQGKSKGGGFSFNFEKFAEMIPENLDEIISNRINEQLSRIQDHLNRQKDHLSRQAEEMAERARERAERAREAAMRQAERARERAERASRKPGPRGRAWASWSADGLPPIPPVPPVPPAAPVPPAPPRRNDPITNEERFAILRMVENKTITIEEAERLLAALEGRG